VLCRQTPPSGRCDGDRIPDLDGRLELFRPVDPATVAAELLPVRPADGVDLPLGERLRLDE